MFMFCVKQDAKQVPLVSDHVLLRKWTLVPSAAAVNQQTLTLTATGRTTPASEPVSLSTIRTSTRAQVNTSIQKDTSMMRAHTQTHLLIPFHGHLHR